MSVMVILQQESMQADSASDVYLFAGWIGQQGGVIVDYEIGYRKELVKQRMASHLLGLQLATQYLAVGMARGIGFFEAHLEATAALRRPDMHVNPLALSHSFVR